MIRQPDLSALRAVGARHGIIKPHRGIRQLSGDPRQVVEAIILISVGTGAWLLAMPAVARIWELMIANAARILRIEGIVTRGQPMIPDFTGAVLPRLDVSLTSPSTTALTVTAIISILAIALTRLMPPRLIPLSYWVRALAAVELSAVAYFALAGSQAVPNVADATLAAGAVIIGMVPIVFGLTLFPFQPSLIRGATIIALTMGHLLVLVPLQYLLQQALVRESSQLLAPACFLALGPALDVMIVVSFYGWAMGRDPRRRAVHPAGVS